jgi:hypothetical protein
VTVDPSGVDARDVLRGERCTGVQMSTRRGVLARPSVERGGRPSPFRDPREASCFGERSRRWECFTWGSASSLLLLFPFGSSGGVAATTGTEGVERRERSLGTRSGDLVRRPFPFPRQSQLALSASDDDDDNCLFTDEGRGTFVLIARSSGTHGAAGALPVAWPPTGFFPSGFSAFPYLIDAFVESPVRVGFVEGEKLSVSPAHDAFPAMSYALTADNL